MEHAGFALTLSAIAIGTMCGLYRQYVVMFVSACVLALLVENGEAAHHWLYSLGNGLFGFLTCSLVAGHAGFFASRWIPWALSAMGVKKVKDSANEQVSSTGQEAQRGDEWKSIS